MFVTGFQDVLNPFKGIEVLTISESEFEHASLQEDCMVSTGRECEIGDVLQATGISRGAGTRVAACR